MIGRHDVYTAKKTPKTLTIDQYFCSFVRSFVRSFDLLVGVLCVSVAEMKMKFVAEDDREDKA